MTAITHARTAGAAGSGLARYRETLRTPGALAFAVPGVVGRMPNAMLSLGLVLLLTAVTGSYGTAGAVSAAAALAYAVTPQLARLADQHGQARVLRRRRRSSPLPPLHWRCARWAGRRYGRWR